MSDLPDYLRSDGDPIATPAFRVIAYWAVDNSDIGAALQITQLFLADYRDGLAWMRYANDTDDSGGKAVTKDSLDTALAWLAAQKGPEFMFRLNGPVDDETDEVGIPQLRLERNTRALQGNRLALEISVPTDSALAFAEKLTPVLQNAPLSFGIMGLGFYLPAALESLIDEMPMAMTRYRTALEMQFESGLPGLLRPTENPGRYWGANPDMLGGIPDIGWRTFIGNEYLPRLPRLAGATFPDSVTLESGAYATTLTAGPTPIWGDVNKAEDISAYSAIAIALDPVAYPRTIAYGNYFGDQESDLEGRARIDGYFARFRG